MLDLASCRSEKWTMFFDVGDIAKVLQQHFKATANILVSAALWTDSYVTMCICGQRESTFSSTRLFFSFLQNILSHCANLKYLCHLETTVRMNSGSSVCHIFFNPKKPKIERVKMIWSLLSEQKAQPNPGSLEGMGFELTTFRINLITRYPLCQG